MKDPYYSRPEVSNSDLSELKKYWQPERIVYDIEQAYKFGTLIDNMITEPDKVDYFLKVCGGEYYTSEDFARAEEMKKAFYRDPFCIQMVKQCSFQKVSVQPSFKIEFEGFEFTLPARAKWDLFCDSLDLGGDIKSTTATTQKQCEEALRYFDYDRSRAWYMDLENRTNDIVIFISKVNYKVFKIPVKKGGEIYNQGKAKYQELAFMWWSYFGNTNNSAGNNAEAAEECKAILSPEFI